MNSPSQAGGGATADLIASLQSLLGTVVIAVFVITFVVQAFQIPSESMMNTLLVGDYLLVNKLCYGRAGLGDHLMPYREIARGDIVVFHYPVDPKQHFVKRVIGVPGDHLRLVNKQVWIKGKRFEGALRSVSGASEQPVSRQFSAPRHSGGRARGQVVAGDAETGGGWAAHCARGTLFCDGRQPRQQPGQPLLGLCAARKYYRAGRC